MTKRQHSDRVCVLPGENSWIQEAAYLEDAFGLLGRATEVAKANGNADRYVRPDLTYRIAENTLGRIKDEVLEGGRPTVHLVVIQAFELDALWEVLNILQRARDGEEGTAEVAGLAEGFGQCFSPSRTAASFAADHGTCQLAPSVHLRRSPLLRKSSSNAVNASSPYARDSASTARPARQAERVLNLR